MNINIIQYIKNKLYYIFIQCNILETILLTIRKMNEELPKIKAAVVQKKGDEGFSEKNPKKLRLNFNNNEPHIINKGRIVSLLEHCGYQCSKIKVNFDSPRTQEAAEQMGLCLTDCLKKPLNYLGDSDNPLTKKKYEYYLMRAKNNIQEIFEKRKEIIYQNSQKSEIEAPSTCKARSKSNIPGDYSNHILNFFSNLPSGLQYKSKLLLDPAERREIQNYIQRTAKELRMIEDEHRRSESQTMKNSRANENSKCLSRVNCSSQKAFQKLPISLEPRKLREEPQIPAESRTQIFFTEAKSSDLQKQIFSRVEGRREVLRSLKKKELLEKKRKMDEDQQWEADIQRLHSFRQRFEKADTIADVSNTQKILKATRSSSNCGIIKEKLGEQKTSQTEAVINSYYTKAKKIEKSKMMRDNLIAEKVEHQRYELLLKKKKQEKRIERRKQLQEENVENYTKKLKERDEKTQFIKTQYNLKKQDWKNLNNFSKDIQEENRARLLRCEDFKRKKMWKTHKNLHELNEKRISEHQLNQCKIRIQTICDRQGKESTYKFLNLLNKADPNKTEQRKSIMQVLHSLSGHFNMGSLRLPLSEDDSQNTLIENIYEF